MHVVAKPSVFGRLLFVETLTVAATRSRVRCGLAYEPGEIAVLPRNCAIG
jgi:hypothetical protein